MRVINGVVALLACKVLTELTRSLRSSRHLIVELLYNLTLEESLDGQRPCINIIYNGMRLKPGPPTSRITYA